jgi:hypothetical protein
MAIYNNVTAVEIKQQCSGIANEIERYMARWKWFADKLNTISSADMTAMGIDADYQAQIGALRVACLNIELKYKNATPVSADDPSYTTKLFSQLTVF